MMETVGTTPEIYRDGSHVIRIPYTAPQHQHAIDANCPGSSNTRRSEYYVFGCISYIRWYCHRIHKCFPRYRCAKFISVSFACKLTRCSTDNEIYSYRSETFGVFNRRFAIFLKDCTQDMFLLAYLLDPSMCVI
jgi:hypothetical protein